MRLSYAQNLEDAHLELLFSGEPPGIYVDVGGGHPVADNVTFWLYLKGWRGLVVEPQAALAEAYAHIRPRDTVFCGLAGSRDGESEFHLVEGLHGLSSMVREVAEQAQRFGAGMTTTRLPMRRLDVLIAEAGFPRVDLLKIDVEGAESAVLAGLDLARVRPRVLVIEAVNPATPGTEPAPWEAVLAAAGYEFAMFDNLNRFYVAREARGLAARLPPEPLKWDAVDHLWDHGRAPHNPGNADHALALTLERGLMAMLPSLPRDVLAGLLRRGLKLAPDAPLGRDQIVKLLGTAEYPGPEPVPQTLDALLASDRFRAAMGRIACFYDGGHIVDDNDAAGRS